MLTGGSTYTWYLSGDTAAQYYYSTSNPYPRGTADFGGGANDYFFFTQMEPARYYGLSIDGAINININQPNNYGLNVYNANGYGAVIAGNGADYSALMVNGYNGAAAANFFGNVAVYGTLSKSAGSFIIDHPLDPENKTLSHSFVESPDMMNIYNGNVKTDKRGYATVTLPKCFAGGATPP